VRLSSLLALEITATVHMDPQARARIVEQGRDFQKLGHWGIVIASSPKYDASGIE
jgi:hypothetical protein